MVNTIKRCYRSHNDRVIAFQLPTHLFISSRRCHVSFILYRFLSLSRCLARPGAVGIYNSPISANRPGSSPLSSCGVVLVVVEVDGEKVGMLECETVVFVPVRTEAFWFCMKRLRRIIPADSP